MSFKLNPTLHELSLQQQVYHEALEQFRTELLWVVEIHTGICRRNLTPNNYLDRVRLHFSQAELQQLALELLS